MSHPSLVDLFLQAVRVEATSLHEKAMAVFVREALAGVPVHVVEDSAAELFGGETGNLICLPASFDPARPAVALFAHLDTPRPTTGVHPVVSDLRITSNGETILGVDNRAGVSVLLHLLHAYGAGGAKENFLVVFTVAEEIGMYGSKHVDLRPYNVRWGFVFDCSKRPGTFIQSAVGCSIFNATFHGRASHAGVAPEKGVNAIQAAAAAIAALPMGRIAPKMTANVGMIQGGSATNVVPDACRIDGEVRSFDQAEIESYLDRAQTIARMAAEQHGATVELISSVDFPPFALDAKSPIFQRTLQAMESVGLKPNPIEYLGGGDANMLNAGGIPSVNLGIGAQNPHGNDEFILLEDLHMSAQIAQKVIGGNGTHA